MTPRCRWTCFGPTRNQRSQAAGYRYHPAGDEPGAGKCRRVSRMIIRSVLMTFGTQQTDPLRKAPADRKSLFPCRGPPAQTDHRINRPPAGDRKNRHRHPDEGPFHRGQAGTGRYQTAGRTGLRRGYLRKQYPASERPSISSPVKPKETFSFILYWDRGMPPAQRERAREYPLSDLPASGSILQPYRRGSHKSTPHVCR